jgi:hypothetical protein
MNQLNHRAMAELFSVKAHLFDIEEMAHPIAPDDLPARLKKAEREVTAMDLAEQVLMYMNHLVDQHMGTEKFPKAMVIAYAPNNLDGLKRVAEYYRRCDLIAAL